MAQEEYQAPQQYFSDINTRLKDLEEKQKLIKDRTLLIGQNLIETKEDNFQEIQQLKKEFMILKEENTKIKDLLQRIAEQIADFSRKEELMILQRQFDMFRGYENE